MRLINLLGLIGVLALTILVGTVTGAVANHRSAKAASYPRVVTADFPLDSPAEAGVLMDCPQQTLNQP